MPREKTKRRAVVLRLYDDLFSRGRMILVCVLQITQSLFGISKSQSRTFYLYVCSSVEGQRTRI